MHPTCDDHGPLSFVEQEISSVLGLNADFIPDASLALLLPNSFKQFAEESLGLSSFQFVDLLPDEVSVADILLCEQSEHVKVVKLVGNVVSYSHHLDIGTSDALAQVRDTHIVLEVFVGPEPVYVVFEVLGVSVGHVVGEEDALIFLLHHVDEGQRVVDAFASDASLVEVVVLVALEELYVGGHVGVQVPTFLRLSIGRVVFILDPG